MTPRPSALDLGTELAPFVGELPDGGIPLFLAGIALLSTQFEWALRVRRWAFAKMRDAAGRARQRTVEAYEDVTDEFARTD